MAHLKAGTYNKQMNKLKEVKTQTIAKAMVVNPIQVIRTMMKVNTTLKRL